MVDEQKAENENLPVAEETESPTVEQEAAPTEPQKEPKEEVLEVESKETEKPALKPVEKRIHKLVDERDREKARAESLAKQVENLTNQFSQPQAVMPTSPTVEPGAEVTLEQYKQDVARQAQAITQLELQKERIINRVNKEALESVKAHPELDPSSDLFDKELSDTITESVKAQIQVNPSASVTRLVNQMMKPYRKAVEKKVAEETATITKQVSETAARPTQIRGVEKSFSELSEKEMEEKLGIVY